MATLAPFAATLAAALAGATVGTAHADPARTDPALLPLRTLICDLGHVTNYDPGHDQSAGELQTDTRHRLDLLLPPIPVRTAPPPDPAEPAEPVDPRTGVLADPTGVLADAPGPFVRVVDMWPERVEMIKQVGTTGTWDLVMISHADAANHTAQILVAHALDMFTYDKARIYTGTCRFDAR